MDSFSTETMGPAQSESANESHENDLPHGLRRTSASTTPTGRRRKRKKVSWVWDHFDVKEDSVVCEECIASNNSEPATFSQATSTGNLGAHLLKKHGITGDGNAADRQGMLSQNGVIQRRNQLVGEPLHDANAALVRMFVDAKLPFSLVVNRGFQSFVRTINSRVPLMSRRSLGRSIEDQWKETAPVIHKLLNDVGSNIGLTCDGWSSRIYRGYFTVTAHWVTEEFEQKDIVLEFVYFPEPHNQWTTKDLLLSIMHDFKIERKVTSITTDNGGEMVAGVEHVRNELNSKYHLDISKDWHIRCVCHVIHRGVEDAMELLKKSVKALRELLKGLRHNKKNRELFAEAQQLLKKETIKDVPGLDVENRWSSMFKMINSCFELRDVFESVCGDDTSSKAVRGRNLSVNEWNNLHGIAAFLKPFSEATQTASTQGNFSVSMLPKIYARLINHCNSNLAGTSILKCVRQASAAMKQKLTKYKFNFTSKYVQICALLNPRISKKGDDYSEMKNYIRKYLEDTYDVSFESDAPTEDNSTKQFSFLDSDDEGVDIIEKDEVDAFFSATASADKSVTNVREWWGSEGRRKYPKIALLARDLLMTMGSSVASESTFSDSGAVIRHDRSRLSDENIRILVTLRSWNRVLGYC